MQFGPVKKAIRTSLKATQTTYEGKTKMFERVLRPRITTWKHTIRVVLANILFEDVDQLS